MLLPPPTTSALKPRPFKTRDFLKGERKKEKKYDSKETLQLYSITDFGDILRSIKLKLPSVFRISIEEGIVTYFLEPKGGSNTNIRN